MIYLRREKEQFEGTKKAFGEAYAALLSEMATVAEAKGRTRDTGSPIHHRKSPSGMVSDIQSKSRRIESLISAHGWQDEPEALSKVVEECTDIANYSLFIAALAVLLGKEIEE